MSKPTAGMRLDRAIAGFKSMWSWELDNAWQQQWSWDGYKGGVYSGTGLHGPGIDYATEVGDLSGNSAIMACINWVMRNIPHSRPIIKREVETGPDDKVPAHPLIKLLKNPNPYYPGRLLWQATAFSYNIGSTGAYWRKLRGPGNNVVQLWWEPHFTIRPASIKGAEEFIDHYEIYRNGHWLEDRRDWLPVEDVVHFKFGMNPYNPRFGMQQLASAIKEVFTDEEAANYAATVLRNTGVVPLIISPKEGVAAMTQADADGIKNMVMQKSQGNRRGEPLVLPAGVTVDKLSYSPAEMDLTAIRTIPVERITSLLGVNRMAAGLGPDPKFANMKEAREAGYEENLLPTFMSFADDLTTQLLPDFTNDETQYVDWDHSRVRALQEDGNLLTTRVAARYDSGYISMNEARKMDGELDPLEGGEVIKVSEKSTLTPLADIGKPPEPPPAPVIMPPASNGNGRAADLEQTEVVAVGQ